MSLDPRFQSLLTSPVFKKTKKDISKVKIDERFQLGLEKIIKDSNTSGTVDQYGRKIKNQKSNKAINEMSTFYDIDTKRKDSQSSKSNGNVLDERLDYLTKLSRGEIQESENESCSDQEDSMDNSDDDNTNSDDDNKDAYTGSDTHTFAIPNQEDSYIFTEVSSNRLAIQNCDWENVSAEDLMVILQSFCPTGKTTAVRKVTIYVSDFGKERMELESKYGPQGIWKTVQNDIVDSDDEDEDDDDDDEDDLYEKIITADEKTFKENYDGDFERVNNVVGLVMQEDLKYLGKASKDLSHEGSSKSDKKIVADDDCIDEIELRKYELSKLRYYFAIAECESENIVNTLYEELNDVELEHTSMILDMSIVPPEVQFTSREIKDVCTGVSNDSINNSYKPPDFVVNALQHTNVECSWDTEKQREKKLTNFSSWRNLNESELQQYIASSDSETSNNSKNRVKALRKMLLNDDCSEDSELNSNNNDGDEFFMGDETNIQSDKDDEEEDSKFNKSISYIPELEKGFLKSNKQNLSNETPYESQLRKSAEKRKSRKALLKVMKTNHNESQSSLNNNNNNNIEIDKHQSEHLELLLDDNTDNNLRDYDMREIVLSEKNKKSKKKKQKKTDVNTTNSLLFDDFKIDTSDTRFNKLFQGDSKYGIDKTASEYKQTPATREILDLVTKSRKDLSYESKQILSKDKSDVTFDKSASALDNSDILANKLKRKFKKQL